METPGHPSSNLWKQTLVCRSAVSAPASPESQPKSPQYLRSRPSVGGSWEGVYGEISGRWRGGGEAQFVRAERAGREESVGETSDVEKEAKEEQEEGAERRDSGKNFSDPVSSPKPESECKPEAEADSWSGSTLTPTNTERIETERSSSPVRWRSSPKPYTATRSGDGTLSLELHAIASLAALPELLASSEIAGVNYICAEHFIILAADNEAESSTTPAITMFNAHEDGSISVFCYCSSDRRSDRTSIEKTGVSTRGFLLYDSSSDSETAACNDDNVNEENDGSFRVCVCGVERLLTSLLTSDEDKAWKEPEHVQAKRRMWRRLSSGPRVPQALSQMLASSTEADAWPEGALWTLLRKFVALLRPKLGCDPHDEKTVCGLEVFERPVCDGRDGGGGCGKGSFHVAGKVEGAEIDVFGAVIGNEVFGSC